MNAVGMALIWLGYALFVIGFDKVTSGCTPVKDIVWISGKQGDVRVVCPSANPKT